MLTLITLILIYVLHFYFKRRNFAPGPPCVPILGCIPFVKNFGIRTMTSSETSHFGKIVRFDFNVYCYHMINDFHLAKELFNQEAFCHRPENFMINHIRGNKGQSHGVINTSGQEWSQQRRFSLTKLRDFGFGRNGLDGAIQEEATQLIQDLLDKRNTGGDLYVDGIFSIYIVNVLWKIVASKRYDPQAAETKEMMAKLNMRFRTGLEWRAFIPALRPYLGFGPCDKAILESKDRIRQLIAEHETELEEGQAPRDFIDIYLTEMKKPDASSSFHKEQLVTICLDFFDAGAETSSTTLTWALLYLALNPDVQEKCRAEIESVLGASIPVRSDMTKLMYTTATIMEIQRLSTTVPGTLPHRTSEDLHVDGHLIPKGSNLIANITKFMLDPSVFKNPKKFDPERFISNGEIKKYDQFVPFGIGKRACMGESLAKHEIFIFFVMILQKLKIGVADNKPNPNPQNYTMGVTAMPRPFFINIDQI